MKVKRSVRKAVEIGVLVAAVSALMLAGCGGGGGSAGKSSVGNGFIAALTDGVGLRTLSLVANPTEATVLTATAVTSDTYEFVSNKKTWQGSSWQAASATVTGYSLSLAGIWVNNTVSPRITSKTVDSITIEGEVLTMLAVDLSGARIQAGKDYNLIDPAISGGSAVINVGALAIPSASAVYPAGSKAWIGINQTYAQDEYSVYYLAFSIQTPTAKLTSLNFSDAVSYTTSSPLCYGGIRLVYVSSPATDTARFDVYPSLSNCIAVSLGTISDGTVDITYKLARTQPVAEFSNYTGTGTSWFSDVSGTIVMPAFMALINGEVYHGTKVPAGTNENVLMANGNRKPTGLLNKTAMDAVMTAVGAPSF